MQCRIDFFFLQEFSWRKMGKKTRIKSHPKYILHRATVWKTMTLFMPCCCYHQRALRKIAFYRLRSFGPPFFPPALQPKLDRWRVFYLGNSFINFNFFFSSNDKQRNIIHLQQTQMVWKNFSFLSLSHPLLLSASFSEINCRCIGNDYNSAVSMKIKSLFKLIRLRSLLCTFFFSLDFISDIKQQPFTLL